MKPKEIAALLGGFDSVRSDEVLAGLGPSSGTEVAKAIRAGFKGGDEQGNARRLTALVKIEGEKALDVVRAVLEDEVEVEGIYSNLRNTALELVRSRFHGHPSLAKSLWRALEIDEYMGVALFSEVVAPYDPERALALLVPQAEQGSPTAIAALAKSTSGRPKLVALLDAALAKGGDAANAFVEALGDEARAPDLAPKIASHAGELPAAAVLAAETDEAVARRTADKLSSKDYAWQQAACRALARLPRGEVFERVSPLLEAPDRTKPAALSRLDLVATWVQSLDDPRWLARLRERLAAEESASVRELIVPLLGKVGPKAVDAIISAPRDDKDTKVIASMLDTLSTFGSDKSVIAKVRAAAEAAGAKGKRAKALREALEMLEQPD